MRLPNGYGSVRKLSGNRRNPYMVEKTDGWVLDENNKRIKQKRVTIGYFPTRAKALQALADFNANPYDLNASKATFSEVYEAWNERKFKSISASNVKGYKSAYNLSSSLHDVLFKDIKLKQLQDLVDNSGKNTPTLRKLKILWSQMFEYAVVHDIISKDKNIVEYVDISQPGNPDARKRKRFATAEIQALWDNVYYDMRLSITLMFIYSGVRTSELLDLKKEDVHLQDRYFNVVKSKTKAGVRSVPIAAKTLPFFKYWFERSQGEYLLCGEDNISKIKYENFKEVYFENLLPTIGVSNHLPYDTRHTCISLLAAAKVNQTFIKKIVGHSNSESITERVYTHFEIHELLDAIDLI